jgi:hypothetical protein
VGKGERGLRFCCHRHRGRGGGLGPDIVRLTAVKKTKRQGADTLSRRIDHEISEGATTDGEPGSVRSRYRPPQTTSISLIPDRLARTLPA